MNQKVVIGAVVGALLILALGGYAVFQGGNPMPAQSSSSGQSGRSVSVASSSGTTPGSQGGAEQGALAVAATDPTTAASGVSKVYVKYSGVEVHSAQSDSVHGWVNLNASGSLELTSDVNVSQTIASAKVQSGAYDMARLGVTSVTVVYNNQNVTASVSSSQLEAHLLSQVQVNASAASAAVVDFHSVIINAGNGTSPQFIFSASVKATAVPSSDVNSATLSIGSRMNLNGKAWWSQFEAQSTAKLQITDATLSSGSLSLRVKDVGGDNTTVHAVTVTPASSTGSSVTIFASALPSSLAGSSVIALNQNTTTQTSGQVSAQSLFGDSGLNLAAGASTTLAYNGTIQLTSNGVLQLAGLVQGQQYLVTCISGDAAATTVVTAS